jgi:drug/metabolite transporter (DMT)-like permease
MARRDRLDAAAIAVLTLLCALWGVQQVAIKVAVHDGLPPVLQGAIRSGGAALLGTLWLAARRGGAGLLLALRHPGALGPGIAIAVLFGVEFVLIYLGLKFTTASRSVLLIATAPFFTALGVHLLVPQERLGALQAVGLVIAFAGVAAALADGLTRRSGDPFGDLLCALGAVFWAATTIVIKSAKALRTVPAIALLLYQLGGSAPVLLAGSALLGEFAVPLHPSALAWAALFYQTAIVAFASYLVWFWLVQTYPAARLAGFTFLTPMFGILASGLLLGEPISTGLYVGLAAVALGLRLVNRRRPAPA